MPAKELVRKVVDTRFKRRHLYHLPGADGKLLATAAVVILDFLIDQADLHEGKGGHPGKFFCTAPTMQRHTAIPERTQRRHIDALVAAGFILHRNRGNGGIKKVRWFKINYRAIARALAAAPPLHSYYHVP